jgi:hypothetical protein
MAQVTHDSGMELALLILLLVVGPLALRFGTDSRVDEVEHERRWLQLDQR